MTTFNKQELEACKTCEDARLFFKELETYDLSKFIKALEAAQEFITLTMRDELLLQVAKSEINIVRGFHTH